MQIRIENNTGLKKLNFDDKKQLMARIGDYAVVAIKNRTNKGVDYNDKSFVPYSEKYLDYRLKNNGTALVNLKSVPKSKKKKIAASTHMIQSVKIQSLKSDEVEIGLTGFNLEKAVWNAERKGAEREFLGLSNNDEKEIEKMIDKYIDSKLK